MKALMYHYVRQSDSRLPHFTYLHRRDFRRQLDHLAENGGFVSRDAFFESLHTGRPVPGHVLTFDDGFSDHATEVVPELTSRGLWGLFFVPTGPYVTGRLLGVHRIHMLLGRLGGARALSLLESHLDEAMLQPEHVDLFRGRTYWNQVLDEHTQVFKNVLNYYVSYEHRGTLLETMMEAVFGDEAEAVRSFYAAPEDLVAMARAGMVIGSHTDSHPVLSKLPRVEQEREIAVSFGWLADCLGEPATTFCYPYGGFHSFTPETEEILAANGCVVAFNVESRDIEGRDLLHRPLALPRYDCNEFPHGRATTGNAAAHAPQRDE